MSRKMSSRARGGSLRSTISTSDSADDEEGWGIANMSLKTGDVKDRKNLWTRKSRLSAPWVLRSITSPSGQLKVSLGFMVVM